MIILRIMTHCRLITRLLQVAKGKTGRHIQEAFYHNRQASQAILRSMPLPSRH